MTVYSPEKQQLYTGKDEAEGSYSFIAKLPGRYRFCFSNSNAASTAKTISFEVASGTDLKDIAAHPDHITPLEHGVYQLSEALRAAREDSTYMYRRESQVRFFLLCCCFLLDRALCVQHRDLTEATYERLRYAAVMEAVVLVGMSVAQILYLRRFFERKRVV